MPSPTQHFADLGAPLRNMRWSWGARESRGAIIIRAWDDEIELIRGKRHIRLTNHNAYSGSSHPGYRERVRHVDEIRQGAPGYVVICRAEARTPRNRKLQGFDSQTLTQIASITNYQGDEWGELGEIVSIDRFLS